jgi:hypothetical protein
VATLVKAELYKIDSALTGTPRDKVLTCPINPEALKISYSNQVEPAKSDDEAGKAKKPAKGKKGAPAGGQFVSKLGTKLAVTLTLDVSVPGDPPTADVRTLTAKVLGLLTPDQSNAPPGVELLWGSMMFRGFLESVEESLEYFSPAGVALRATLALSITRPALQTGVNESFKPSAAATPGTRKPAAGTVPMAEAPAGGSVQGMVATAKANGGPTGTAGANGLPGGDISWQAVASANGIDDPLRLPAGRRLDLTAGARIKFGT